MPTVLCHCQPILWGNSITCHFWGQHHLPRLGAASPATAVTPLALPRPAAAKGGCPACKGMASALCLSRFFSDEWCKPLLKVAEVGMGVGGQRPLPCACHTSSRTSGASC